MRALVIKVASMDHMLAQVRDDLRAKPFSSVDSREQPWIHPEACWRSDITLVLSSGHGEIMLEECSHGTASESNAYPRAESYLAPLENCGSYNRVLGKDK